MPAGGISRQLQGAAGDPVHQDVPGCSGKQAGCQSQRLVSLRLAIAPAAAGPGRGSLTFPAAMATTVIISASQGP